jgi:hypothetical protein
MSLAPKKLNFTEDQAVMSLQPIYTRNGTVIHCPYPQKENAKELGAKWDPNKKTWYIPFAIKDHDPFRKWMDVTVLENVPRYHSNAMRKLGAAWSHVLGRWFITSDADQKLFQDFLPASLADGDSVNDDDDGMDTFIDHDGDYYSEGEDNYGSESEETAEFTTESESSDSEEDDGIDEVVMPTRPPNQVDLVAEQARLISEKKIRSLFETEDKRIDSDIRCPECSLLPKYCACVPSSEDEESSHPMSTSILERYVEERESELEEDQDFELISGRKRKSVRILDESSSLSSAEDSDEPLIFRSLQRSKRKRIRPSIILESGDELCMSTPKKRNVGEPLSPPPSLQKPHKITRRTKSSQS